MFQFSNLLLEFFFKLSNLKKKNPKFNILILKIIIWIFNHYLNLNKNS
jgi:hypothetical protein